MPPTTTKGAAEFAFVTSVLIPLDPGNALVIRENTRTPYRRRDPTPPAEKIDARKSAFNHLANAVPEKHLVCCTGQQSFWEGPRSRGVVVWAVRSFEKGMGGCRRGRRVNSQSECGLGAVGLRG